MFPGGAGAKARDAVHGLFAGEKVLPDDPLATPDASKVEDVRRHPTSKLDPLVRRKRTAFRDKDRMHLRDVIDGELVDESWCERLPRFNRLLDDPNG